MLISEYRDFLCRIKDEHIPAIQSILAEDVIGLIHSKRRELEELIKNVEQSGCPEPEYNQSITDPLYHIEEHLDAVVHKHNKALDCISQDIDNVLINISFINDNTSFLDPGIFDSTPELHNSLHISSSLAQSYETILDAVCEGEYSLTRILDKEYAALDQLIMLIESPIACDEHAIWSQLYENIDFLRQQQAIPVP